MTNITSTFAPFLRWFDGEGFWTGARDLSVPESTPHRIHLTRHDHHNLELKTFIEPGKSGFQSWMDVHLFVPSSFQLSRWEKKELRHDLHCRTRLAISVCAEQGQVAVREALRCLRTITEESHQLDSLGDELLIESGKDTGAVIHETLRKWAANHKKKCRLAFSLIHREQDACTHLTRLCHEVRRTAECIEMVRRELADLGTERYPILALLEEYSSNLYLKYLSDMEHELAQCPTDRFQSAAYRQVTHELSAILRDLRQSEAALLNKHHPHPKATDKEREDYLVRLSQLKKFFQSKMFVDVSRRTKDKRIRETIAFVGTALAGLSAACLQLYLTSDEMAVSGALFLGVGVLVYTLRDRIKDYLKKELASKASAWIPDMEQSLWVDGKKMGFTKEWSRISGKKNMDRGVKTLRHRGRLTEMEMELPEEVFSWKRWQSIPGLTNNRQTELALQENVRINLERYLKFMDDPFKELAVLDPSGQFTRFRSRRVYHFYLAVRSTCRNGTERTPGQNWPAEPDKQQIFRVVLNKKGIDRIETIDDLTTPNEPEWYHSHHAHPSSPLQPTDRPHPG